IGTNSYNQRLSVNRANSVVKFLTEKGINKNRMKITGEGETKPIAINTYEDGSDCPQGREFNRRVDMHVIETENESIVTEEVIVPEELKIKKQ
ncbi:MAG: OmpA family protein, partial [Bacteroidales bacterium]